MKNNIHVFKDRHGRGFAVDPNSGAVHEVSDEAFALLTVLCALPKLPDINSFSGADAQLYAEILKLREAGLLFSAGDFSKYAENAGGVTKALCLNVCHDCNLRCPYCFAGDGRYGGAALGDAARMTPEIARKAIDFLLANCGDRQNLEVDFFGGEPLLAWDTVVETVRYGRRVQGGKNIRFTLTTNGLLLDDEKIGFINSEMSNVVMSLDGRKEVHDRLRKTASGAGSYDVIVPKFQKLVNTRTKPGYTDYYTRGTFTKYNLDFSEDLRHMYELGFKNVSIEPVIGEGEWGIGESDLPRIFEEYDRVGELLENLPDMLFFHFNIDLQGGPCIAKRLRGCGCGGEYMAVTPSGALYPCHQYAAMPDKKIGDIFSGAVNAGAREYYKGLHVYSKRGCADCWARFYCSGGCNANSALLCGDERVPHYIYCALMKMRIEVALTLK